MAWAAVATLAVFAQANGTSGMPGSRLTTVANVRDVREFDYSTRRRGRGINRSSNGLVQPFQLAREVQIVGGTRRHRWLNAAFLFAEGPILFVVLTGAGGLISRFFAGRKAGPSRSTGQG